MGEVYVDVFGSITFATFGVTPVKGARSHVTPCPGRGDWRAMFVDISPPVRTRAVGAQVAQGPRRGRGDGLGTWVCEQRMSEPKPATNGVREIVVARRRRAGQRLMDDMKIIISNRTSMLYMRMIPGKLRIGEVYVDVFGSITFAIIWSNASKRGTESCDAVSWTSRSASDACRYLAARRNACCGRAGGARTSSRARRRPRHLGMRSAHT